MPGLPKILDIRDDLRRAEDASEQDISDERETVVELLDDYAARDRGSDEGNLDQIDEELLRLQERGDDEAGEYLQSARNRIRIFRNSLGGEDDEFVVVDTRSGSDGAESTVDVTVVNNAGAPTAGRVTVTFFDEDGNELETVTAETGEFDAGEQRTVSVPVDPPEGDARYVASAERSA